LLDLLDPRDRFLREVAELPRLLAAAYCSDNV
jgi:hypothetical protein